MSAAQTHTCKRAPFNRSEETRVELQALMQGVTSYHALYAILLIMKLKTELYSLPDVLHLNMFVCGYCSK